MNETTNTEATKGEPEQPGKKTVGRSAKPFPYTDLQAAQVIAAKVQEIGVDTCKREQVATSLGVDVNGGGFRSKVGAASKFGLVTAKGGQLTLTDLGKRVLDHQTRESALVESFLSVAVFQDLYKKLENVPKPKPDAIQRQLQELGVIASQVSRARQVFMKSADYAGFYRLHPDRLMQPGHTSPDTNSAEQPTAQTPPEEEQDRNKTNGATGQLLEKGRGQPLLEALFATRPSSEEKWTLSQWMEWLEALMPILRMDYRNHQALRQIEVAISKSDDASVNKDTMGGAP